MGIPQHTYASTDRSTFDPFPASYKYIDLTLLVQNASRSRKYFVPMCFMKMLEYNLDSVFTITILTFSQVQHSLLGHKHLSNTVIHTVTLPLTRIQFRHTRCQTDKPKVYKYTCMSVYGCTERICI